MKYKIISLDSFNPLNMNLVKSREKWYGSDDHSRWVFEEGGLYYKIWNKTYIRRNQVKFGIDCKFYDETTVPAFVGLIYHEDICRGYVTKKCEEFSGDTTFFTEIVKNKTKETKSFNYDFTEKHVMKFENKFSLIDLEGIYPLSEYEDIAEDRNHASFSSDKYKRFVYEIYKNK
tara:strand:- start:3804 stop:4325 length:522 start_codon:yes stop_codon:yes gene_type:complete